MQGCRGFAGVRPGRRSLASSRLSSPLLGREGSLPALEELRGCRLVAPMLAAACSGETEWDAAAVGSSENKKGVLVG